MKIRDLFAPGRTLLSFEFFPPKNVESEHVLDETVSSLGRFHPDFVSVTYGAGGGTSEKTLAWTLRMRDLFHMNVVMHLTCVAASRAQMGEMVHRLRKERIFNILALRGDPPKDSPREGIWTDFSHAVELVEFLASQDGFSIGVAGYPEGHPEAASLAEDMDHLKAKVDAGADFVTTQLFFENRFFFDFVSRAQKAGIRVPIIAGIMPIVTLGQVQRFTQMCGASVPDALVRRMYGLGEDDMLRVGVEYAVDQCRELLSSGVAGLHFYTLNRNRATEMILDEMGGELGRKRVES